jgi:SAM-dependent methyltransferase
MLQANQLPNPGLAVVKRPVDSAANDRPRANHACPLCGFSVTTHAFRDNGCDLRVCDTCELFFVDPYPAGKRQHQRVSRGSFDEIEILDCARRYEGERLYYERHFDSIAEECTDARSLLDVGCGTGHLLELFATRPELRRMGIELNTQAARFARYVSGCEILEIPFEQFRSDERFDVITLINVFSHIPSLDALFNSLRAVLAPGGKVILRTSEMRRDVSRWNQLHWGVPDDLHFLGLRTLEFLCAKFGFVVARHVQIPFEKELFRRSRWQQMGRSRVTNGIKMLGLYTPFALTALERVYTAALGQRLFVSFIVLTPLRSGPAIVSMGKK